MKKKILSMFMAFIMVMNIIVIPGGGFVIEAEALISIPILNDFKAQELRDNHVYQFLKSEYEAPYHVFVDTIDNDAFFQAQLILWKAVTFNLDDIVNEITNATQFKYYSGVLFDVLYDGSEKANAFGLLNEAFDKVSAFNLGEFSKIAGNLEDIPITPANANIILNEMQVLGNFSNLFKVFDYIDDFATFISFCHSYNDLINRLSMIEVLHNSSKETAQVLTRK